MNPLNEESARTGAPPTTGPENVASLPEAVGLTALQRAQWALAEIETNRLSDALNVLRLQAARRLGHPRGLRRAA